MTQIEQTPGAGTAAGAAGRPVAVLGAGPMGTALARALLRSGIPTTVWNRSPGRAAALRDEGATTADDATAAAGAAEVVLVCVRDHAAALDALGRVDPAVLAGRVVVNLSSATPGEARRSAAWAAQRGVPYLNGSIMVSTPLVGTPDALVLCSGERAAFERSADVLRVVAGRTEHLGDDPGRAALFDVAMLEVFFAGMTSFLHAAAMVTAQGVTAAEFLPYAREITALLPVVAEGLARDVDAGTHPGTEDRLAMELVALEHVAATSAALGLDGRLPDLLRDLAAEAVRAGGGDDGFSRLVRVLRAPAPEPVAG